MKRRVGFLLNVGMILSVLLIAAGCSSGENNSAGAVKVTLSGILDNSTVQHREGTRDAKEVFISRFKELK